MPDPKSTPTPSRYRAPALEKGLEILEFLARQGSGYSRSELGRHLGRSTNEIHRMLACLSEQGYIHRSAADDRYRLTSKLFELAHSHPPTRFLLDLSLPIMRRFCEEAEQSCHLVVPSDHKAVVVAHVDSPDFVSLGVRTGAVLPLQETASGRVLAAFQASDLLESWLAHVETELTKKARKEFLLTLETIRVQGYEESPSGIVEGVLDLSVPIRVPEGHAIAALTVPCVLRKDRAVDKLHVLELMREATEQIAQSAGSWTWTRGET